MVGNLPSPVEAAADFLLQLPGDHGSMKSQFRACYRRWIRAHMSTADYQEVEQGTKIDL